MIQYFLMYISMDGTEVLFMYCILNDYYYYLFTELTHLIMVLGHLTTSFIYIYNIQLRILEHQ